MATCPSYSKALTLLKQVNSLSRSYGKKKYSFVTLSSIKYHKYMLIFLKHIKELRLNLKKACNHNITADQRMNHG